MKTLIVAFAALAILAAAVVAYLLFTGPHMEVQDKVKTWSLPKQLPPPGTVMAESVPLAARSNPISATRGNIERGKACYEYYCVFCHGETGKGDGEVGQSYDPRPADLSSARVRAYADAELVEAMLTGAGHAPVLGRVVPEGDRWYLALYVRSLGRMEAVK